ncbi:Phosphopantetheine adenylyltransferase OS=Tsukamurella paurometabola (strain ATCC 8368 / DSM/ CCUG 35730 / CIP 100753 / JCM 10117 / KCTC 9821 / NBRC 16120/ NCIMB 702349 / NCTC 13040) OX=521096 GN=Tpau_2732 PE=4 SV=1 [Tsukamurella paurometabola]|uniref:Phosphopantetheine adenylyltransferase n=1 Tax=Tsukamurella paurometabola (strain ATCC 8368 / DSM 20162 / CCUG 35730 / CIP 100753 / JCM 10117 / KCTC 9821 / NBRC 16120 / NCIMB 702349 / NCTC 13040) TaxID=521096 RepID=D5USQ9_TSUPD|nr:conserved hypothetical protein [Tsukamurella paurometabola DSM 20162]SUP35114.1 Uncharacterised protein [Tsukamurella paurometabola]
MVKQKLGRALLAGVGMAHLAPAVAIVSRDRLERSYGITVSDSDTELLLRHRATFFGLLGCGLIYAAAEPRYRGPAITAGAVSLGSYLALAQSIGAGPRLMQVKRLDVGLLAALSAAAALTR